MATPISWAQEIITCDLCDNPTQQFCNSCQVNLCMTCINKHIEMFKSFKHDMVPFKNRKIQPFPECELHESQRCEAHCQQCDVPVCIKCVISSHNGHNISDIPSTFNEKKKELQMDTQEIESNILPKYKKENEEAEQKITKSTDKFDDLQKETEKQRKFWYLEVETIFNNFSSLIESMRDNCLDKMKSQQSKLEKLIPDMIQTVQQNKEILKANKVSDVISYKSKLTEYRNRHTDTDMTVPSLKTNTVQGKELSIEIEKYKATLTQTALSSLTDEASYLSMRGLLDKARIITTIPTGYTPLRTVACVGADETWVIGDERTIRLVDIHGSVRDTVTIKSFLCPIHIAVTSQGELLYVNALNRTVNIVKQGKPGTSITTPRGWHPEGVCSTRAGNILVNMNNGEENKIFCYQGQKVKYKIYNDEKGQPIFGRGATMLFLAENNNGDICATDIKNEVVVAFDTTGRVRFRYDGKPAGKMRINPRQIVTDSMSQIIVTDMLNNCLHILNQKGHFLRCVDNCRLISPCGLSIDRKDRLWVGLVDSGEMKVIQYMKQSILLSFIFIPM